MGAVPAPRPAGIVMFLRRNIGDPGPCDSERGEVTGEWDGVTAREAALDADREWIWW